MGDSTFFNGRIVVINNNVDNRVDIYKKKTKLLEGYLYNSYEIKIEKIIFFEGTEGHAFWHELDRHDDDLVIDKSRFSAFVDGASSLDKKLRDRNIKSLVVTGTLTNICCESTVRDAMMLDYQCIVIEDANAAQTDYEHLAALENIARVFGDVITTDDFLKTLAHG